QRVPKRCLQEPPNPKPPVWILDFGFWILDSSIRRQLEVEISDFGFWIRAFHHCSITPFVHQSILGQLFTHISVRESFTSALRCSSTWVTRRTSSMVVWAARTLFQPSMRRVRMPCTIAFCAIVEAGARLRIRGRKDSFRLS